MKGHDIASRLRRFAVAAIRLCRSLPDEAAGKHISRQLLRAATAGGANYEEARGAESLADFIHKLGITNKELREAEYWLLLSLDAELLAGDELSAVLREVGELVAIITASLNTAKARAGRSQTMVNGQR